MAKKVDCTEFAKAINELAMVIGSQEGVQTLDDVVAEIQKSFPTMPREDIVNAIVDANTYEARKVEEIAKRLTEIKRDARLEKATQERITELEKYLESGILPGSKPRPEPKGGVIGALRAVRDDLKKQLAQSEPAQRVRLEKQIAALEERIAEGDIAPKAKPPTIPLSKDLERLAYKRDQLRRKIRLAVLDLKPKSIWYRMADPFNAIRALKTSFDFSNVFRQAGFIAFGHPIRGARALPDMFRAVASPIKAKKINDEILDRPNAPLYAKTKLYLAPTDGSETLAQKEEAFMSRIAERIPGVKASQRAYVTFLNKLRADSFDAMAATLSKTGEPTLQEAQAIATFINEATGRGSLGKAEGYGVGLNTVFFAPKYSVSRFQLLLGHPLWGGTNATRKLIAQEYGRYLIGIAVVYMLGWLAGGETEDDPRSSDFGKIRFGNSRIDPLSGISQTAVLVSRLALGETKSSATGNVSPIRGPDVPYGGTTTPEVLMRFLRGKLSPTFGIPLDVISGENIVGEHVTPISAAWGAPVPMQFDDIYKAMKEQSVPYGVSLSMLSIFGMGLQTYGQKQNPIERLSDITKVKDQEEWPLDPGKWRPNSGRDSEVDRLRAQIDTLSPKELEEAQARREERRKTKSQESWQKRFQKMTDDELDKALESHTYQTATKPSKANGYQGHFPGDPIKGSEDIVDWIEVEMDRRAKK